MIRERAAEYDIDQFFAWMQAQGLTRKPGDPDMKPTPRGLGPRRGGPPPTTGRGGR
jgi:hypothetical protein